MPSSPRVPDTPRLTRGSVAGAVLFAVVAAALIVAGYLWIDGRRARKAEQAAPSPTWIGAADKWTGRLGKFLAKGPDGGTWETQFLSSVCQHYIREHPDRPGAFLIAQVGPTGAREAQVVSRWLVPRHFFRAPSSLFFSNYRRSEGPVRETLADGTDTWRVHWAPRAHPDGLTERRVWFTVGSGDVIQVEDHSRAGHLIRRVRLVSLGTADWNPSALPVENMETCEVEPPDPTADPERLLLEAVDEAPFPVFVPAQIPAGFVLVRSSYSVCDATRSTERLQEEPVPAKATGTSVHLVTQLYSDGMALISVAVAPTDDMDVIDAVTAGMGGGGDAGGCPGLPSDPRDIRTNGRVVRMRTDVCRTVLRRDYDEDVSVTIIGRNELPSEEYLRMMDSLEEVDSVRSKKSGSGAGG